MAVPPPTPVEVENAEGARARSNRWGLLLRAALSIGLTALVVAFVDWREFISAMPAMRLRYLAAFAALFFADRLLMAFKWRLLLQAAGLDVPIGRLFRLYLASLVAGTFLPATVGQDLFRVWYLGRYGLDRSAVFSSIVVERVAAFAAILLLCSCGLVLAILTRVQGDPALRAGGAVVLLGAAVLAAFAGLLRPEVVRLVERFRHCRLAGTLARVLHQVQAYRRHAKTVRIFFLLTFLEQLVPTASVYLLLQGFSISCRLLDLIIIVPLITFSMRLPISIDGLGVKEGLFVVLFGTVGVSPAKAFLVSTVDRILPLLCSLPWAIGLLSMRPKENKA